MTGYSTTVSSTYALSEVSGGVSELFRAQVDASRDRVAAHFDGRQLTYGQISDRIRSFTTTLFEAGVKRGDKVGIYFLNHPDFVTAFFSVLGLGATVVPINPLLKADEIAHIIEDSGATSVICHERLTSELDLSLKTLGDGIQTFVLSYSEKVIEDISGQVTIIDGNVLDETGKVGSSILADGLARHGVLCQPDDLAVIVYTSGTTGKPKGAMLTHSNLKAAIEVMRTRVDVGPEDCVFAALPLCHIFGMVLVMLGSMSRGASLAILESFDAVRALQIIEEKGVTILPAVPAMFQFMSMAAEGNNYDLSSVRYGITGGAACPPELLAAAEKTFAAPIREGYALSETTCVGCITPSEGPVKTGSAGPVMERIEMIVLDNDLNQLPRGEIGQIAIAGPNVMSGYYRQPRATEDSFHGRFFLTGDLGYLDEDGYIFINGRIKEMIIRGGQNIYPREIEAVLASHASIVDAAVVGVPDKFMGERVKAFVVVKPGSELTEDEVKEYCSEHLASYKVPRLVEFIETLPRNSTGKVLKRLLTS